MKEAQKGCDYKLGCHECTHRLMFLHAQIRQFLSEPEINRERIRNEIIAVKRLIEDIVGVGEAEDRGVVEGDGVSPPR